MTLSLRAEVALCEEGVDRNKYCTAMEISSSLVALCEEGVDRNSSVMLSSSHLYVALCEEGVDRNWTIMEGLHYPLASPSAKRAWIEIETSMGDFEDVGVALCEEGVDRNVPCCAMVSQLSGRPLRRGRG